MASQRTVRSYVLRAGRITSAQRRALDELWPRFGVDWHPAPLDLDRIFGRRAPRVLEIGFGNGGTLVEMARTEPDTDFLGIEVHEPGVGHCLLQIERLGLGNVRLIRHDAVEVLREQIPAASLQAVLLLFPDPWPKKRHHKRRILTPEFAQLVAARLAPGGLFHVATDWAPYAEHIAAVMAAERAFTPQPPGQRAGGPTRFERRGEQLGHAIFESSWRRSTGHPA
ncbi:MAG: tRNA (guanosine(46)-N7)-methyltransferase TrmB [Gammaproteobacteria bacterium]|nr:MAG: tRNA (guanosine(46)-N7)-methyltransferase TrmB [Gammaproteobacteria bacterium]